MCFNVKYKDCMCHMDLKISIRKKMQVQHNYWFNETCSKDIHTNLMAMGQYH
jgi:hypothetical protein